MITFITHGLGGNASHWSNILVESGTVEAPTYKREFAYEPNSLIEQLRNKAGDADVYWASFDNDTNFQLVVCPIVTVSDTLYNIDSLTKVSSISSISNHIIVVFENDNDYDLSHEEIYNQFNFVADKVIYDVKQLNNGLLPRVNLIGHSRGGLINLMYAMDHPLLVDSIFSLGTP